jgi:hypothetical protein
VVDEGEECQQTWRETNLYVLSLVRGLKTNSMTRLTDDTFSGPWNTPVSILGHLPVMIPDIKMP